MHPFCAPGGLARHGLRLVSQASADDTRPACNMRISGICAGTPWTAGTRLGCLVPAAAQGRLIS